MHYPFVALKTGILGVFIRLSGSGKSTIAYALVVKLLGIGGRHVTLLARRPGVQTSVE